MRRRAKVPDFTFMLVEFFCAEELERRKADHEYLK